MMSKAREEPAEELSKVRVAFQVPPEHVSKVLSQFRDLITLEKEEAAAEAKPLISESEKLSAVVTNLAVMLAQPWLHQTSVIAPADPEAFRAAAHSRWVECAMRTSRFIQSLTERVREKVDEYLRTRNVPSQVEAVKSWRAHRWLVRVALMSFLVASQMVMNSALGNLPASQIPNWIKAHLGYITD